MAVGTTQLSWGIVAGHRDVIMKMIESERISGKPPYLAFVYDVLRRNNLARRAERKDPELDLNKALTTVDKECLDVARARLDSVLAEAGLKGKLQSSGSAPSGAVAPPPGDMWRDGSGAAAAASQSLAKAEQIQKAQQAAAASLKSTQEMIMAKGQAMKGGADKGGKAGAGRGKGGKAGGGGKPTSQRADGFSNAKDRKWHSWQDAKKQRNGW